MGRQSSGSPMTGRKRPRTLPAATVSVRKLLPGRLHSALPFDRPGGEEGLEHGVVHQVEPRLKAVYKFMQAFFDDVVDIGEVELRPQDAQMLLGWSRSGAARRASNAVQ